MRPLLVSKISTLNPYLLQSTDFINLSLNRQITASDSILSSRPSFYSRTKFPPATTGFLYYHVPEDLPLIAGEIRFRMTPGNDISKFYRSPDLRLPHGLLWSIPLWRMVPRPDSDSPYAFFRRLLLQDDMVSQKTIDHCTALFAEHLGPDGGLRKQRLQRVIFCLGQPFAVRPCARQRLALWIVGNVAVTHTIFSYYAGKLMGSFGSSSYPHTCIERASPGTYVTQIQGAFDGTFRTSLQPPKLINKLTNRSLVLALDELPDMQNAEAEDSYTQTEHNQTNAVDAYQDTSTSESEETADSELYTDYRLSSQQAFSTKFVTFYKEKFCSSEVYGQRATPVHNFAVNRLQKSDLHNLSGQVFRHSLKIGEDTVTLEMPTDIRVSGQWHFVLPQDTRGFFYYHCPSHLPSTAGSLRFRVVPYGDPKHFDSGYDLQSFDDTEWNLPLWKLVSEPSYAPILDRLQEQKLVDSDLIAKCRLLFGKLKRASKRIIHGLNHPFRVPVGVKVTVLHLVTKDGLKPLVIKNTFLDPLHLPGEAPEILVRNYNVLVQIERVGFRLIIRLLDVHPDIAHLMKYQVGHHVPLSISQYGENLIPFLDMTFEDTRSIIGLKKPKEKESEATKALTISSIP